MKQEIFQITIGSNRYNGFYNFLEYADNPVRGAYLSIESDGVEVFRRPDAWEDLGDEMSAEFFVENQIVKVNEFIRGLDLEPAVDLDKDGQIEFLEKAFHLWKTQVKFQDGEFKTDWVPFLKDLKQIDG
jgi:hypothetical protein